MRLTDVRSVLLTGPFTNGLLLKECRRIIRCGYGEGPRQRHGAQFSRKCRQMIRYGYLSDMNVQATIPH